MSTLQDGYTVFKDGRLIADSECSPLIPNLVRNHFSALSVMNALSKSSKPPVVGRVIARFKRQQPEAGGDTHFKVQPVLEGRIVCVNGVEE